VAAIPERIDCFAGDCRLASMILVLSAVAMLVARRLAAACGKGDDTPMIVRLPMQVGKVAAGALIA